MANFTGNFFIFILLRNFSISNLDIDFVILDALITYFAICSFVVPPLLLWIFWSSQHCVFDLSTLVWLECSLHCLFFILWIEKVVLRGPTCKSCLFQLFLLVRINVGGSNLLLILLVVWNIRVLSIIKFVVQELTKGGRF